MQRLLPLMRNRRFLFITGLIFAAALSRLLPHPYNFSPVGAMALFAGARFGKLGIAITVPLAALLVSDIFIGFYAGAWLVYATFVAVVVLGHVALKNKRHPLAIGGCAALASMLFFLVTNCVWLYNENLYALTLEGQITSYIAALPFLWNTLVGDLFYTALLFGGLTFTERKTSLLGSNCAART